MIIGIADRVQTRPESIAGPSMATSPSLTGSAFIEAPCIIPAVPTPASLTNIALLAPVRATAVKAQGQAADIMIAARETEKTRKELYDIISKHSGQSYDKVFADADRDFWMTAQEALEYGMVDEILTKKSK